MYPDGFDLQALNAIADSEASDYYVIPRTDLNAMILDAIPNTRRPWVSNLDRSYTIASANLVSTMIEMDRTNIQSYISEFYDCDDFAFNLFGDVRSVPVTVFVSNKAPVALGVVFGMLPNGIRHAANLYVTLEDGVVCLEPQSDETSTCDEMFSSIDTIII